MVSTRMSRSTIEPSPPPPQAPDTAPSAVDASSRTARDRALRGVTVSLRVLAVCAAIAVLKFAAPVLLPIVMSVLLFYMLDPIVDRLERWRVPRAVGAVGVILLLVGGLASGVVFLWPQVEAVVVKIPAAADRLRTTFRAQVDTEADTALEKVQAAAKAIDTAAAEAAEPSPSAPGVVRVEVQQPWRVSDWLWASGMGALALLGQAVTILFLTIFLLVEDDSFKRRLVRRVEGLGRRRITVQVLNDIARQIEGFIWVQVLTSAVVALITGVVLWWLGVEQPAVWGLFAGVMNIVPYFGPLIVTVVLAAVGYLQFESIPMATLVAAIALVITTLEGMLLTPSLLSRAASLNHVAIFVAIAFWSWAWGIPGMLLGVPLLMALKAICDHVPGLEGVADFLGSSTREPAAES